MYYVKGKTSSQLFFNRSKNHVRIGLDYHLGTGVRRALNFQSYYAHDIFMKKLLTPQGF